MDTLDIASAQNRRYVLASRPDGMVGAEHFNFESMALAPLQEGEVRVRTHLLSLDPAMRGWLNEGKSYVPPVQIGEVMRAIAAGQVVESRHDKFVAGDFVTGMLGVQDYASGKPSGLNLQKVDPKLVPLPRYLGVLGMPGMTAYFGMLKEAAPQAGETVLVSGAAGAVGSIAGQLAKIQGARVVGIAGGADKCREVVEDYGFDACIDYKSESLPEALRQHCPDGVNVYFDNVGGDVLDAALARLAQGARVIICGAISQYNVEGGNIRGPANYLSLLVNRATMKGIVVFDYVQDYRAAGMQMAQWMMQGKLTAREHVVDGLEQFPQALGMLFSGANHGKLVLRVVGDAG